MGNSELLIWIKERPLNSATYPAGSVIGIWFWSGTSRPDWSFALIAAVALICMLAPAVDRHRRTRRQR